MRPIALAIATAGGAGFVPVAPGTAGSAVGIVIYFLTRHWPPGWQATLVVAISVVGVWAASEAARHFNREDPSQVVIDEVAGQLVTVLLLGVGALGAAIGFLLFRVFDVMKPWPVGRLEALPAGLGVMADDLMAGAYGWVVLRAATAAVPGGW
jgi:phosphatidylglycerophosphatase A